MPVTVRKKGRRFAIVEKETGKVKGYSTSRAKAQASANARNAAKHGWQATGKRRRGR